ncbi:Tn3 family transposase [Streptomyces sp. NBC_01622]|nr:Tn3 family transposase [Streptomyces sp. NBC_00878]MCX4908523.1 Tn3 family transposase [Streptomyces sp. NBC_00878]WTE48697.1 Tn3 family transposase [Streptomyces sp. NBC_01622]
MEDQIGSLGLVLDAVVLWTTQYIDAAVAQLRAEGPRDPRRGRRPPVPAQAPQPQRPGPLQLQCLHPCRREPAAVARSASGRARRR